MPAVHRHAKPILFGKRYQIPPVLVNTSKLIYQFHDGEAREVMAVYDSAVPLVLHSTVDSFDKLKALGIDDPESSTWTG